MRTYFFIVVLMFVSAPVIPVFADDSADLIDSVDARYKQTATLARTIWEFAEVGYLEEKSSALLADTLSAEGFEVETGVAGMPTAFIASYGESGPVIGILAEFDALPGITQDSVGKRAPIPDKAAGHACGHNLFGAGSVGAAIAVRHWLEESRTPGVVRLYGTPAEEGGSGKVYLVREGFFDDVDVVLHWHADDENSAKSRPNLANRSAKFRFTGISAHAAGSPHKARSALDGVEAMNYMANLMREHIPQESRIHYVITRGGNAPNVVPDFAEVFYYVRHPDAEKLLEIWQRLESAALGAAQGTNTEVTWEIIHGNNAMLINETLQKMMDDKLKRVGGVEYTSEEQAFAEEIYATFTDPKFALGSQADVQPYEVSQGYGSTDVGDISLVVPTAGLRIATWVPGTSSHSWQAVAASGTSIGFKGAQVAAKALALGAVELFRNEELRNAARQEFEERRGDNFRYEPLLGDRDPPLDFRK